MTRVRPTETQIEFRTVTGGGPDSPRWVGHSQHWIDHSFESFGATPWEAIFGALSRYIGLNTRCSCCGQVDVDWSLVPARWGRP